jgi:RNA polymerase sigma-70 factor (ECF subfamily)
MNTLTDAVILAQINNPKSFDLVFVKLVAKYELKIQNQILKIVKDHNDAQDLTQEVFIKIWNGIRNFKGESQLSTWIHRIAFNEAIIFLNKKKRLPLERLEKELLENVYTCSESYHDENSILEKFEQCLAQLPAKQQAVVKTRYYDETSFENISIASGTSVGALKASYHFGIKKIISRIKEME